MGTAKKVGIGIAVVIGVLVILGIVGSTMIEPALTAPSKYEGLTEQEIERVKIVYEQCETSAYLAGAGSDTRIQQGLERCADLEAKLIAKYRAEN